MCMSHSTLSYIYGITMWCNRVIRKIGTRSSHIRRPSCVSSLDCTVGSPHISHMLTVCICMHTITHKYNMYCTYNHTQIHHVLYILSYTNTSCTVHTIIHKYVRRAVCTITHKYVMYCTYNHTQICTLCTVHTITHKYVMYCT